MPTTNQPTSVRVAVAQTTSHRDPADVQAFQAAGAEVRALIRQAHQLGADLVHFPEATLCFPDKMALSSQPGKLADADWSRFAWPALDGEIGSIKALTRVCGLWTVLGAQHREPAAARPQTSLYVIDPNGQVHCRYDERLLSRSKQTYLYEPGTLPVTFEINGVRFGCTSGLEVLFPDLYNDYEAGQVDCVLFSTAGTPDPAEGDSLASSARTNALHTGMWISYAVPCDKAHYAAAGIIRPGGQWAARCAEEPEPAIVTADIAPRPEGAPREWRRAMLMSHRQT